MNQSKIIRKKLIVIGDGCCGKTCLLTVFQKDQFPEHYTPTVFETAIVQVEVEDKVVELAVWDTAGQEDFAPLRALTYPDTNVILICFSIDNTDSLLNAQERWALEVSQHCPEVPFMLVGNKKDLRDDGELIERLNAAGRRLVAREEGIKVAKNIGAIYYSECSAKLKEGVDDVFKTAVLLTIKSKMRGNLFKARRDKGGNKCTLL